MEQPEAPYLKIRLFEYSPQTSTLISLKPGSGGFILLAPGPTTPRGSQYLRIATVLSTEKRVRGLVYDPRGSGMLVIDIAQGAVPPSDERLGDWLSEHPKRIPGGPSLPGEPIIVKPG
jgi:hypothetical protein